MSWKDGMVNYQKSLMQCQGCRRIFEWETASHPDKGVVTLSEYGVEDFHRHGPWTCPFCKGTFRRRMRCRRFIWGM